MILIKRKKSSHYIVYNIAERSRSSTWSTTIQETINNRFNRSSFKQYSDISLEKALKLDGNHILWHIPITGVITENEIKQQYPECFI